jgi:hypothetical protein
MVLDGAPEVSKLHHNQSQENIRTAEWPQNQRMPNLKGDK